MIEPFYNISIRILQQIKLIITDVDGTITSARGELGISALKAIRKAERRNIPVGFISGRPICELEALARYVGASGPLIAENGGVAKLNVNSEIINLGYSREPALRALSHLKNILGNRIQETGDNRCRLVDIGLRRTEIKSSEIEHCLINNQDVTVLDSGVMIHLVEKDVEKGRTLLLILEKLGNLSAQNIIVFGDSMTDLSMFSLFENGVFIVNHALEPDDYKIICKKAHFTSSKPYSEGFAEVIEHLLSNLSS